MKKLLVGCLVLSLSSIIGCDDGGGVQIDEGAGDFGQSVTSVPDPGESHYLWNVSNTWSDTNTPTGETWEEYYATWVGQITVGADDYVQYALPDGTTVPAPQLECADTAMFLRFFYAKHHNLPVIIRAGNVFYGHFGAVNRDGSTANVLHYTYEASQHYPTPADTPEQYFNELMGVEASRMLRMMLTLAGSVTLAENTVAYYIGAQSVRPGDLQIHRYGSDGIGHAITIQNVTWSPDHTVIESIQLMDSVMPSYPGIYDGRSELTDYDSCLTDQGQELEMYPDGGMSCDEYMQENGQESLTEFYYKTEYGGGLRRWLIPVRSGNTWHLRVSRDAVSQDTARRNPGAFQQLIVMSLEEQVDSVIATIDVAREKLYDNPNSCSRRRDREEAFNNLYNLYFMNPELLPELGLSEGASIEDVMLAVDRAYRNIDDFIWAQMDYDVSWVCHWNPEPGDMTNELYDAAAELNGMRLEAQGCQGLTIFAAHNVSGSDNGFDWIFDQVSYENSYNNDENGNLSGITNDTPLRADLMDWFCSVYDSIDFYYGF